MKKIYKVITDNNTIDLENDINEAMDEGWKPQGGISVNVFMYTSGSQPREVTTFAQAMIKNVYESHSMDGL